MSTGSSRRSSPTPNSRRRSFFELYAAYESDGRKFVSKKRAVALAHLRARGRRRRASSPALAPRQQPGHQPRAHHLQHHPLRTRLPPPRHPHAPRAGRRHDRLRPRAGRRLGDERPLSRAFADTCARKVSCYDPCGIKYLSPEEEHSMSTIEQTAAEHPDRHVAGGHRPLARRLRGAVRRRDVLG